MSILGLAFKPNTDYSHEAQSLKIFEALEAVVTEWQEFIDANWTMIAANVANQVVFDGRNALPATGLQQAGWTYIGIEKERK